MLCCCDMALRPAQSSVSYVLAVTRSPTMVVDHCDAHSLVLQNHVRTPTSCTLKFQPLAVRRAELLRLGFCSSILAWQQDHLTILSCSLALPIYTASLTSWRPSPTSPNQVDVTSKTEGRAFAEQQNTSNNPLLVKYDQRLRDNVANTIVADITTAVTDHERSSMGQAPPAHGSKPKQFPRVAMDLASTVERIQQNFVISDPGLPDCPIVFASDAFLELTGGQGVGRLGWPPLHSFSAPWGGHHVGCNPSIPLVPVLEYTWDGSTSQPDTLRTKVVMY